MVGEGGRCVEQEETGWSGDGCVGQYRFLHSEDRKLITGILVSRGDEMEQSLAVYGDAAIVRFFGEQVDDPMSLRTVKVGLNLVYTAADSAETSSSSGAVSRTLPAVV